MNKRSGHRSNKILDSGPRSAEPGRRHLFGYSRTRWLGIISAVWIAMGMLCAAQIYLKSVLANDGAVPLSRALMYALPVWMIWIPATFGVIGLCKRYDFGSSTRVTSFFAHGFGSLGFAFLHMVFHAYWLLVRSSIPVEFRTLSAQTIHLLDDIWLQLDLLVYCGIAGAYFSLNYYERFRERQIRTLRMTARLNEARLTALKAQIHPHFLFNTLSAIQTMVLKKGTDQAAEMITRLSDYLRLTLAEDKEQTIPFGKELNFVKQYLSIEKYRFGERLAVKYDIPEELLSRKVPAFLLQPVVENAITHGLAPKEGTMKLTISATLCGQKITITVSDNGAGKKAANGSAPGTGLRRTEERLREIYGERYDFDYMYPEKGGFLVTIRIPAADVELEPAANPETVTLKRSVYDPGNNRGR